MSRKKRFIYYLPVYGSLSAGVIYACIGVVAILSFLQIRHGGADEYSILAIFYEYTIGKILIGVILTGTFCYIIWRLYEAFTDPYGYGHRLTGIGKRTGIVLSTLADILLVYTSIRIFWGISDIRPDGQPTEERAMVHDLLQNEYGTGLVISIGCVYLITAIIQWWYGVSKGYKERINIDRFPWWVRRFVHVLAWLGYGARGIILGIIGFFYIKAGWLRNENDVVNTDKAFDFIGDHIGHIWFILVAVATICYGLFMFAQGVAYDVDKD